MADSQTSGTGATEQAGLPYQGPAADFELVDEDGRSLHLSDFRGRLVLLNFFYSDCPDFCPTMNGDLKRIYLSLEEDHSGQVIFLSITFDPVTDTPEKLKEYARERGFDLPGWHFLTGSPEEIDRVVRAYGIPVQEVIPELHVHPDGTSHQHERDFGHMAQALLIDQDGEVRRAYLGLSGGKEVFSSKLVLRDIGSLLGSTN